MDGSDPSRAGPIAERPGSSFGGFGDSHGKLTDHCNSMWSPLTAALKSLLPDLKATRSPSTVPSTIGVGTSSPRKILRPFGVSVSLLQSCRKVNTCVDANHHGTQVVRRPNGRRHGSLQSRDSRAGSYRLLPRRHLGTQLHRFGSDQKCFNAPPPPALSPPTSSAQTQSARRQNTPAPYTENHPRTTTTATAH
jgi:hypothetical protein